MITVKEPVCYIEEIKKSIFTTWVSCANSVEEAFAFIEAKSLKSATHNCWAYLINGEYRFSDDGEPSSTAGKPMYTSIEHSKFENIVVLVTRESSGIKLGTGGLVRAYGGSTAKALNLCEELEIKEFFPLLFKVSFQHTGKIYHVINDFFAIKVDELFENDGVNFSVKVEINRVDAFKEALINSTNGEVTFIEIE